MTRLIPAAAIAGFLLGVGSTYAQSPARQERSTFPAGSIEGRVLDDKQGPIAGAMVSVVGRATSVATTDRDGRFALRELPFGPYILSVHSRGYWKSRGRTIQLTSKTVSVPEIQLTRFASDKDPALAAAMTPPEPDPPTQLAGFGLDLPIVPEEAAAQPPATAPAASAEEEGETAWRLRHLPRSILKDVTTEAVWTDTTRDFEPATWLGRGAVVVTPIAFFSELPLSGQVNLLTIESFDRPGRMFAADSARNVAFVSVNTRAAGGAWAMQGAMTQGDLSSWIVAGSYKSIESASHAYDLGLSYSTQRYEGGNVAALAAIHDNARNVGTVYGHDQWTVSPRLVLGYGTGYARYDYLGGSGLWSPRLSLTIPLDGFRLKALVSRRAVVPGAEEFAPSVTGLWLPQARTFSSLAADAAFTPEQTRHLQVSVERDLATGVTVSLRGFRQRVDDQLIEIFGDLPGSPAAPLGHYFVGSAGDLDARGWGVSMIQEVPGYLRSSVEYTVTTAYWLGSDTTFGRGVRSIALASTENVYDLQTSVEATIPQTATRIYARYRMNTAFWSDDADVLPVARPNANTRFNVRVNQSLPFLRFSNADWEMLLDVRNMFRDADAEASIYDEALAVRAPKRIVGGLLVKF